MTAASRQVFVTGATRLGLVTIDQMIAALVAAVENPPSPGAITIVDVPGIRSP